jgi:hypothetical protein
MTMPGQVSVESGLGHRLVELTELVHEIIRARDPACTRATGAAGDRVLEAASAIARAAASDPAGRRAERIALLHEALHSTRAAVVALRFALVEEGDAARLDQSPAR